LGGTGGVLTVGKQELVEEQVRDNDFGFALAGHGILGKTFI
jgi:hypothetical protein